MKTLLLASLTLLISNTGIAQSDPPGRVARLNLATGAVSMLSQATGPDWVPAQINYPLTSGDQVWTDFDGRAELHLGTAAIRLRAETSATFTTLDDQIVQMQLVAGGLNIHVRQFYQGDVLEIDTPNLAFTIRQAGDYRIDVVGQQTKVIVWAGAGEIFGEGRDFPLRGRDAVTVGGNRQLSYTLTTASGPDEFDRWSQDRDRRFVQSQSARYVASDMIGAEDLDLYGSWSEVADLGPVWRPRVDVNWSPYKTGHWAWIEPWGWTWIDDAPWGFAPFHYGRWATVAGSWVWVPGPANSRAVYSPALVAWSGGISVGGGRAGLAWFPLGPREVYVPSHRASVEYVTRVNISNTVVNRTTITNFYNNRTTINNINYANQRAVVGMANADMAAGRRGARPVAVQTGQVTAIAPPPVSRPVMQAMPRDGGGPVARPPETQNRSVVTRNPAPTSRPAFVSPQRQNPAEDPARRTGDRQPEMVRPIAPTQTRPDNPDRPRRTERPAEAPLTTNPPARPADRFDRPMDRMQPRVDAPVAAPPPVRPTEHMDHPATPPAEHPQPRVERPTVPAERRVEPPVTSNPPLRPADRFDRPMDRAQPRVEAPVATPPPVRPPEHMDRPATPPAEHSQPRVERPTAPAERRPEPPVTSNPPLRPADRFDRPTDRAQPRVEAPVAAPPPVPPPERREERTTGRPDPRGERPRQEEKKPEKKEEKKDDKKQ